MKRWIAKKPMCPAANPHFTKLTIRKLCIVIPKLGPTARANVVIRRRIC